MLGEGWEPKRHLKERKAQTLAGCYKKASSQMTSDPGWL